MIPMAWFRRDAFGFRGGDLLESLKGVLACESVGFAFAFGELVLLARVDPRE